MSIVLEAVNISKVYGNGVYANKNINFNVLEGEIHAIVGENGAGKSTLMKIIFGLEAPTSGDLIIRGEKTVFSSPQEAIDAGIGMVHQHFKLVNSLSIVENVIIGYEPLKNRLIDLKTAKTKVAEIAKIFKLNEDLGTPVAKVPVGSKQKIEIIKTLYRGAKIIILDEPTAVLTPQETEDLFEQLKYLRASGYTVIFISHKLREVKELSDRITVIRRGEVIETFNTADVSEQEISDRMMGKAYSTSVTKETSVVGKTVLSVKNACAKGLNQQNLVDDMSFTVNGGEVLGVAGVEGNGQNELIELITGLRKIDGGVIAINGQEINRKSVKAIRDQGLSYIPSDRLEKGLAAQMSIRDNLISTKLDDPDLYQRGLLSKKKVTDLSRDLIKRFLIKADSPETEIGMLSGGNMQKVVVARELTQKSNLIIAEQPTRGVDVGAAKFIYEELMALRKQGTAILLATADLEELFKLSDKIIVVYDGKIAAYFEDLVNVSEKDLGKYMLGVEKQPEVQILEAYYER